jgi:ribonuclease T2
VRELPVWAAVSLLAITAASAQIAVTGALKASKACPALQSIRSGSNPGDVKLEIGQSYPLIAKNKQDATYYRVAVEGAAPRERWVEVGCGDVGGTPTPTPTPTSTSAGGGGSDGVEATHVLAVSWEPAFCEEKGEKAECQRETEQSFEATHFSLHGLWPQPNGNFYCGVDRTLKDADKRNHWGDLPEPDLSAATHDRLAAEMPGVLSMLERHEWIKHGTCFGADANTYFNREAELAEQLNASAARELFAGRIGQSVSLADIRGAFDTAFGPGAGARVVVHCQGSGGQREISELIIYLAGGVNGSAPLADLMHAAAPPANEPNCPSGVVAEAAR